MTSDRLRLPLSFDVAALQADLRRLEAHPWIAHFVKGNYEGDWSVLPLRGPSGATHPVQAIYSDPSVTDYADTPLMQDCPAIAAALSRLQCPLEAVRLMRLGPGAIIKPHRDHDLDAEHGRARLHIPIVTNADVEFVLNGERVVLAEGECWYLRLSDPHEVANRGATARVHLVVDAIVSPWLHERLAEAQAAAPEAHRVARPAAATLNVMQPSLPRWIPARVTAGGEVEWCDLGGASFAEPFLEQTVDRARRRSGTSGVARTSFDALEEEVARQTPIAPTAFIFHASRCGSTLMSQMVRSLPHTVVVSESPAVDDVLRSGEADATRVARLGSVLRALAVPRRPGDRWFFVKFDAWHVLDVDVVARAFPGVPCVFVYREPAAIIASQMRMPGLYFQPGQLDPAIAGVTLDRALAMPREEYCARLLGRIFSDAARHVAADRLTPMHFGDFPRRAVAQALEWTGLDDDDAPARRLLEETATLDAKTPGLPYERRADGPSASARAAAARFVNATYAEIEARRLGNKRADEIVS